jgi:two-component system nitrogen regulation response regulator GlnG
MPTLLVIDDETSILAAFRRAFHAPDYDVLAAETAAQGLELAQSHRPDVVIIDVHLPDLPGLELLEKLRAAEARTPVIFISGKGTTDTAIEAMRLGAFDYLLKPLELSALREVIGKAAAISRLMHVPTLVGPEEPVDDRADAIIGRCPAMQTAYKAIGRVAGQDVTVLLTGETGTGKELVARAIYQHSGRARGPFLALNCAAIPESLLESELFGHEKGAFTGADRQRIGKFEQCNGGTLFLDEIGDLAPTTQAKLLRLLQDQTFQRLGGSETIRTDVRVLTATNRDLDGEDRFRRDLFYRLAVFSIHLPPLRERGDDLALLVRHFLRRFNRELGKCVETIAPEAMAALQRHAWPGNVRELQSVIKQAILQSTGPVLLTDFLPSFSHSSDHGADATALEVFVDARLSAGSHSLYAEALERMERALLTRVLRHTGGNQLQAARILGITRGSLRTKIRDLGIRIDRSVSSSADSEN